MKLGFIGMGNMAKALLSGFISAGVVEKKDVFAFAPNQKKLAANAELIGFNPVYDLKKLVNSTDTVIMACKPHQVETVLSEIAELLKGKTLISIALGWNFKRYNAILKDVKIQYVMPNTPVSTSEGVLLFEDENSLQDYERAEIFNLFKSIGKVIELPAELMGIGGAISGCGPAFVYLFIESYADMAVKYGLRRELAYMLVSQTLLGAAKLQLSTGKHPGELKDDVCSPKGSTIKGVTALEREGFRRACQASIDEIMRNG